MTCGVEAAGGARAGCSVGTPETMLSALVTADDSISWQTFLHVSGPTLDFISGKDGPGV